MPVIAIVKQKGGVGKTILATNLVVAFAQTHTVMLLNADTQGSSQDWAERAGVNGTSTWRCSMPAMLGSSAAAGEKAVGGRLQLGHHRWSCGHQPDQRRGGFRAVQHLPQAGQQIWVDGGVEDVGGGHLVLLVQTVGGWPLPNIFLRAAASCLYRDNVQVLYPLEMSAVVGEQGQVMAQGSGAYQKVEIADDVSGGPQAPPFYGESAADTVIQ